MPHEALPRVRSVGFLPPDFSVRLFPVEQPSFGHELLIEAVSVLMLVELARYARQLEKRSSNQGTDPTLAPWQLRRIQDRIQASPDMGWYPKLNELGELCDISQSHLMRTFKASTGWQIHKYIAAERLKTAKQCLPRGS